MFTYTINQKPQSIELDHSIIDHIFFSISKEEDSPHFGIVNIVFLPDEEIQTLNNNYRQKNLTTDVLSFHYYDDFSTLECNSIAGEVILSEKQIHSQAIEYGLGSEKECYKLIIHSIFHILGYDHVEDKEYQVMKEKEEKIWHKIFINI